jgi:anion-transporting  ArsA/GET3 family ATPase
VDILDRRFLFVVGKGGVGKTTVATALALAASRRDKKVLLAMVNCKERVSELLHTEPIGSEIVSLSENLDAVNMTPSSALEEYGRMVLKVRAIYNAVFQNKLVRAFLQGTPGLEAWSMLGKAFFHASPTKGEPEYDLVILDAPATGHALDMLRVPVVIEQVAPPGLLRREAERALKLFRDPSQGGAVVVTLPEEMPVNETMELTDALRDELEIPVLRLVVNRVLPELFLPEESDAVRGLPNGLPEGSPIRGLSLAGRRRSLRETVQRQALKRVCDYVGVPCTKLPHFFGLDENVQTLHALSRALGAGS